MERIQKILNHPLYQEQFKLLQDAEKDREFCRHTMEHFVDVARLMYIYTLEEKTNVSKELIYAAALLYAQMGAKSVVISPPSLINTVHSQTSLSACLISNCFVFNH